MRCTDLKKDTSNPRAAQSVDTSVGSPEPFTSPTSHDASSLDESQFEGSPCDLAVEFENLNVLKASGRPRNPVSGGGELVEQRLQVRGELDSVICPRCG